MGENMADYGPRERLAYLEQIQVRNTELIAANWDIIKANTELITRMIERQERADARQARADERQERIDERLDRVAEMQARNQEQIDALSRDIRFLFASVQGHVSQPHPPAHTEQTG